MRTDRELARVQRDPLSHSTLLHALTWIADANQHGEYEHASALSAAWQSAAKAEAATGGDAA